MFTAALFILGKSGNNPNVHQQMCGYTNCGQYTHKWLHSTYTLQPLIP